MAIAKTPSNSFTPGQNNKLLNAWPEIMQESIWHFNQAAGQGAPFLTSPDKGKQVYLQPEREIIARNLEAAIGMIGHELSYWPRPAYFTDYKILSRAWPIEWQTFKTDWKKVIQLGSRTMSLIQADVNVTYSDPQSYGIDTLATIQVTTAVSASEVVAFFRTADGGLSAGDYRYEIEPLTATASGGVVTLTGHRSLFVRPDTIWNNPYTLNNPNNNDPNAADTQQANDFVEKVDIYRVYNDNTTAVNVLAGDGTVLASFTGEIIDFENGIIRMGGDFCTSTCWTQAPYRMSVNYQAGLPLVNGNMDSEMLDAIVALCNARMFNKPINMSSWTQNRWQRDSDPAIQQAAGQAYSLLSPADAKNPFGLRMGEVIAWRVCGRRYVALGGKLTHQWR